MTDTTTITILKSSREDFDARLAKLNKKLMRIKGAGTSSIIKEEDTEITQIDALDQEFKVPAIQITVALPELVQHQGFSFMGTVSLSEGVRTIFATDEGEKSGFNFNEVGNTCDHCGHNRKRNTVHVFRNEAGEFVRIGSTCAKEFFGLDINALLRTSTQIIEACDEMDGDFEGARWTGFSGHELLRAAIILWKRDSFWTSSSKAQMENSCPSSHTLSAMLGRHGFELRKNIEESTLKAMKEVSIAELVEKMEEMFSPNPGENASTFEVNVANALFQGKDRLAEFFPFKTLGLVGWAAFKALNGDEKKEKKIPSQWVGNVGDKINLSCKVSGLRSIDSGFGPSLLVTMTCGTDVVKTFSTARWTDNIEEGDEVTLVGTVKKHEDWKGNKSTVLTRCKVMG